MVALDTSCLDHLSEEADVPRQQVAKVLKGFRRLLNQDIDEPSRIQLEALASRYNTRVRKADEAIQAIAEAKGKLQILVEDGHPDEPGAIVDRQVIEDLTENVESQLASIGRFIPRPITTKGHLTVGEEQAA